MWALLLCSALLSARAYGDTGVVPTVVRWDPYSTEAEADTAVGLFTGRGLQQTTCSGNLACLTNNLLVVQLPSLNLPQLSLPGGGSLDLFGLLAPEPLVSLVDQYASDVADGCTTPGIPIFSGSIITTDGFLGGLADGSCSALSVVRSDLYVVGAVSTKAANFLAQLADKARGDVQKAKEGLGRDLAVCLAADVCSHNYHLGLTGLSGTFIIPLGPLPPLNCEVELQSLSYSKNGDGTGILETSVPLWSASMGTAAQPEPGTILTNLAMKMRGSVTFGYVVNNKKIADLGFDGQLAMAVRWSNPTRFAMQFDGAPTVTLYETFKLDYKALAEATSASLLFYVEHFSPSSWNLYAGATVRANIPGLVNAIGKGTEMSQLLAAMLSADSEVAVDVNLHAYQSGGDTGAAVRLLFRGQVALADQLAQALPPGTPTRFAAGLGVKLAIINRNGRTKVIGFVNINGRDYPFSFCTSNNDCEASQVCVQPLGVGICVRRMGCSATYAPRNIGGILDKGDCSTYPPGTKEIALRCYQPCKQGFYLPNDIIGDKAILCREDCNRDGCPGTAVNCGKRVKLGFLGSVCGLGRTRAAAWDRTGPKRCPQGTFSSGAFCYNSCPQGWRSDLSAGVVPVCVRNDCPAQYPKRCSTGVTLNCLEASASCSDLDKLFVSAWGRC